MTKEITRKGALTIFTLLESKKPEFQKALQNNIKVDHFIRVAMTAMQQNPTLMQCTPASFYDSLMKAAQLSLNCDGLLGQAYLVPFNNNRAGTKEAALIIGYKGLRELALRTSKYKDIYACVVFSNDKLEVRLGSDPYLKHEPTEKERGEMRACYAVAIHKDGTPIWKFKWANEIEKHKKKYSKAWQKKDSIWQTDPEIAWEKTLIRMLCGRLQMSVVAQEVMAREDALQAGVDLPPVDAGFDFDAIPSQDDIEAPVEEKDQGKGVDGLVDELKGKSNGKGPEITRNNPEPIVVSSDPDQEDMSDLWVVVHDWLDQNVPKNKGATKNREAREGKLHSIAKQVFGDEWHGDLSKITKSELQKIYNCMPN